MQVRYNPTSQSHGQTYETHIVSSTNINPFFFAMRRSANLFLLFHLLSSLSSVLSIGYIEQVDCDEKMSVNQALIKYRYENPNSENGIIPSSSLSLSSSTPFSLYGTNHICYKCSKTLIAHEQNQCGLLFSPHPFRLYILENETQHVMTKRDYTFGEHGIYTITYNSGTNKITIDEEKEPVDSLRPLMDLLSVIFVFTFFLFLPSLVAVCSLRLCRDQFDEWKQGTIVNEDSTSAFLLKTFINPGFLDQEDEMKQQREKEPLLEDSSSSQTTPRTVKKSPRLQSLDTFRGFALFMMIFVNYGGGKYWFFEHAEWNGLTVADLLFPWFMWMMGVSMALSFEAMRKQNVSKPILWKKAVQRSATLFGIGMFLANGYELSTWRIPGVLQYFGVSYFVTCFTVLISDTMTVRILKDTKNKEKDYYENSQNWAIHPEDRFLGGLCHPLPSTILFAYRYEWIVQAIILLTYLLLNFATPAPGCESGYLGPGGISQHSDYEGCTGGIHRYLDIQLFTSKLIYHHPTCLELYGCQPYDPEGFLGVLSACNLTYLGLMAGRCCVLFTAHKSRLLRWFLWGIVLLFLSGCLCGFQQNGGFMPINKNLWSTSFVCVTAGGGLLMLSLTYLLVDVYKVWSGFPFRQMGMNSILLYVGHSLLGGYFPFSYKTDSASHSRQLQMNCIGVLSWAAVGYYCYLKKFFVKI